MGKVAKRDAMMRKREEAGYTRKQIADILGYEEETIRQLEYGNVFYGGWTNRKRWIWKALAKIYKCTPEELGN